MHILSTFTEILPFPELNHKHSNSKSNSLIYQNIIKLNLYELNNSNKHASG